MKTVINTDEGVGKVKLRYRLLCLKEKVAEAQDRITQISEQRSDCCNVVTLESEEVTLDGEIVTLN